MAVAPSLIRRAAWPMAAALALVFLALAGAGDSISGIFRQVIWNQTIPDSLRGRLASIEMLSYTSGPALGNFEAGLVADVQPGQALNVVHGHFPPPDGPFPGPRFTVGRGGEGLGRLGEGGFQFLRPGQLPGSQLLGRTARQAHDLLVPHRCRRRCEVIHDTPGR